MIYLETPLTVDKIKQLKAGDEVFLSGTIYTGRDAAHKRLIQLLDRKSTRLNSSHSRASRMPSSA